MRRYALAWVGMLGVAVANGALRQMTFGNFLSELQAHQLSTLVGMVLIGAFMWVVLRRRPPSSGREAIRIGLLWLALTATFECFMGLVLLRKSVAQVLTDYNVFAGRVWVFFLLWIAVAPWLFVRLRATSESRLARARLGTAVSQRREVCASDEDREDAGLGRG